MVFSNAQTSRSQIDQSRQVEADFSSASSASDMWDFTMKRKLQRAHVIQSMPFLAHGSFKSANVSCALNRTKHYEKDIAQADILDMAVMNLGVSPKIIVCSGRADWADWALSPKIRLLQSSKFRIPSRKKLCQFVCSPRATSQKSANFVANLTFSKI